MSSDGILSLPTILNLGPSVKPSIVGVSNDGALFEEMSSIERMFVTNNLTELGLHRPGSVIVN